MQKDSAEDQDSSQKTRRSHLFMQKQYTQNGGGQRIECTEKTGALCTYIALCYRLQGEAKTAANQSKVDNCTPLCSTLRQAGYFEKKSRGETEQTNESDLKNAQ